MDDYKSLIEKLRNVSGLKAGNIVKYLREAADAIEELQQIKEHYKAEADEFYKAACEAKEGNKPRWISIKDRLPESNLGMAVVFMRRRQDAFNEYTWIKLEDTMTADSWGKGGYTSLSYITHWMPLYAPEPPKEDFDADR